MKEKYWITNGVRIAGLVGMFYITRHWWSQYHRFNNVHFNRIWQLVFELIMFGIGVYMLRGAPLFVKFICPKDDDDNKSP